MAATHLRPHPDPRRPGCGVQAAARGRTRLAGHERRPGPAPGVPLPRRPDPRPHPTLLACAATHPGRREHHRRHLAQPAPRARPDAPGHPGHTRRHRRATLSPDPHTEDHPGRARPARTTTILRLHHTHKLSRTPAGLPRCSNTTPTHQNPVSYTH